MIQQLLLLLFVLVCAIFLLISDADDNSNAGPFEAVFRHPHHPNGTEPCAYRCHWDLLRPGIDREARGVYLEIGVLGVFGAEKLENICKLHDKVKSCIDQCTNDSVLKTLTLEELTVWRFSCYESTFKQNTDCIQRVRRLVNATCTAQCQQFEQQQPFDYYNSINKNNNGTDDAAFEAYTKQQCLLSDCQLQCAKPTLIRECARVAFEDVQAVKGKWLHYLKVKTVLEKGKQWESKWPSQCNQTLAME